MCAHLAEAWRKRRYEAAFISKLSDSETEAAETQVWFELAVLAVKCNDLPKDQGRDRYTTDDAILRTLVGMINPPET